MPEKEVTNSTIEEMTPPKPKTPSPTIPKPVAKPTIPEPTAKPTIPKPAAKPATANPLPKLTQQKPAIKKPATANPLPPTIPKPEASKKPKRKLKPGYKFAGKETLSQIIRKSIPKQFISTDRFAVILGLIFLAVVVLALVQFPFGKLLSGDTEIIIGIGYPWPFLELQIMDPEAPPVRIQNLILDLIIYMFIAYAIDVIINYILSSAILKSKKDKKKKPQVYKALTPTMADKITKKVFKNSTTKTINTNPRQKVQTKNPQKSV